MKKQSSFKMKGFGGFGNSNTANFWVNNPTVTNTNPFDLGSDFNLGGVITYTA